MSLARALRVERGAVVSFVGGGGKTTSMFRLATELSAAGFRIVSTTTTHISKEQVHFAPASIAWMRWISWNRAWTSMGTAS